MECASRNNCLSGVQEEEPCPDEARDLEQEYFRMCLSLISFSVYAGPKHNTT